MAAGEGLEADEFIRTVAGTGFPLNQGLSARSRWGEAGLEVRFRVNRRESWRGEECCILSHEVQIDTAPRPTPHPMTSPVPEISYDKHNQRLVALATD